MADTQFRDARWSRAGATEAQLDELRTRHAEMSGTEQAAEAERVDGLSDSDLAAELNADDGDLSAGTMDAVLERVGNDVEAAAVALSHEQGKRRPRPRLVAALNAVIAGGDG